MFEAAFCRIRFEYAVADREAQRMPIQAIKERLTAAGELEQLKQTKELNQSDADIP